MNMNFFKVGWRTRKTVIAVFLCFLIETMRQSSVPFYAAIAAVLCVQNNQENSFRVAKQREVATILGGICGILFLLFEERVFQIPVELLRYLVLAVLLVPIIQLSVWLRQEQGTYLMCVVFLSIVITQEDAASPLAFGMERIISTTIGIVIALLVNLLPFGLPPAETPGQPQAESKPETETPSAAG